MVSEYGWCQFSCSIVVTLGLQLFNQVFRHAEVAGTLAAGTLGSSRAFGSVLDCTALWLHFVFAAAGLAGVHCCSLGVIH